MTLRKPWIQVFGLCLVFGFSACGGDENENPPEGFNVTAADMALMESYNQDFDWSTDKIAIRYLTGPTYSEAHKALYSRNPGLYRDMSTEPDIVPNPLPDIQAGTASGFDFTLSGGDNSGQQVLDNTSIVDTMAETAISGPEQAQALLWSPAVTVFLKDWDITLSTNLYYADLAVKGQTWENAQANLPPQKIEHCYLHDGDLWVELVFEDHLSLGSGITDSNGDGYREIYAQIKPEHFTEAVYNQLAGDYSTMKYNEASLHDLIAGGASSGIIDELYSIFPMELGSGIGIPYVITDLGTIAYPFMVINGMSPKQDYAVVLLVAP